MQAKEKTRIEIESKASSMSDFLKMEYLEECLKQNKTIDVKKFCHSSLAGIYERRNMFLEAAKNMDNLAEIAITFNGKIQAYVKEMELWIKSGQFEKVDETLRKALATGAEKDKAGIKRSVKNAYLAQAQTNERAGRNANALKAYEKLFELAEELEKQEIKIKLLGLYDKLGKVKEFLRLREQIQG